MAAFSLTPIQQDYFAVLHEGRKVGILFPARPFVQADVWPARQALPWSIVPDPEAFPGDPNCNGLPAPLLPEGNRFNSFAEVEAFLGVEQRAEAQAA